MAIGFPKPRPIALERQDRRVTLKDFDDKESAKVKKRSTGQCEMVEQVHRSLTRRCIRRAGHVHHMIGGWGKRARGISALAAHKQHLCWQCHEDYGAHILQRIGGPVPHYKDVYRRVK